MLAAEAISEYVDWNEWQVAGIQKAVASLDRAEGLRMGGSKSGCQLLEPQEGATDS